MIKKLNDLDELLRRIDDEDLREEIHQNIFELLIYIGKEKLFEEVGKDCTTK